jgi:signal transduction histidine kinase
LPFIFKPFSFLPAVKPGVGNRAGISAGDKQRLFGHHTGFGLFLSREILSITGMTITETGEPGKGARFEILVPNGGYRFT